MLNVDDDHQLGCHSPSGEKKGGEGRGGGGENAKST